MEERLREKGWSQEEIEHLSKHFTRKQEALFVTVIATACVLLAALVVPIGYVWVLTTLPLLALVLILVVIGIPLGASLGLLLSDLDRLTHWHHISLMVALPLMVLLAIWIFLSGIVLRNALIGGLAYAVSFMIPYGIVVWSRWNL